MVITGPDSIHSALVRLCDEQLQKKKEKKRGFKKEILMLARLQKISIIV